MRPVPTLRLAVLQLLLALAGFSAGADAAQSALAAQPREYLRIPAGEFHSVLRYEDLPGNRQVAAFELMREPVTNAQFLAFIARHPQWRRDRVAPLYAERGLYLAHWHSATRLGKDALPDQPVTRVSWFAATAYCEARHARLPTWNEWEYVAAADATRRDARQDPAWRAGILEWYSTNAHAPLGVVGSHEANAYGVQDLHGLIWEWTEDYAALLVSGDNRLQSDADRLKFCGAGALSVDDRDNYPMMMRVALLASLRGANSISTLGFRCARDLP
jgi:formylglycine-generating enzyme required for sulfatase activity